MTAGRSPLRHELEDAELEVRAVLGGTTLSVATLQALKPGDVLTTDFAGTVTLIVEDLPIFRGRYGHSRGQCAVKITERMHRQPLPAHQSREFQ